MEKQKKLVEWEKQYRLDHPVYNLNHSNPSIAFGAVLAFIGAIMLVPFEMNQTTVTRYAFFCFVIGYAVDWFCKRERWKAYNKYKKFEDL